MKVDMSIYEDLALVVAANASRDKLNGPLIDAVAVSFE